MRVTKAKSEPSKKVRMSIDIKRVRTVERDRTVRFLVKIDEYVKTTKFDQMVFFHLTSDQDHRDFMVGWSA